jgi:hypothetical protein
VNYAKLGLVPLNMSHQQAHVMARTFGCQIQAMPFTYLGLPMGSTKPRIEHFAPLMDRAKRQLTTISSLLTLARRLQLVNSALSSLPTFTMWRKSDSNAKCKPLVTWRKCTRPKRKGGLGVINLKSQNMPSS